MLPYDLGGVTTTELAKSERNLLDAMERHSTVKEAALSIRMDPGRANQVLYRLRKKIRRAEGFLGDIRRREKQSKLTAKILMERK